MFIRRSGRMAGASPSASSDRAQSRKMYTVSIRHGKISEKDNRVNDL